MNRSGDQGRGGHPGATSYGDESTVYKLAQEGQIPTKKIGRHWRFDRHTLERWILQHC